MEEGAEKKNKQNKTKPYLFLPLPWSHMSRTPRSLRCCFHSPVKREKLMRVLQANENYVVKKKINENAEMTHPCNSCKGCLKGAYLLMLLS